MKASLLRNETAKENVVNRRRELNPGGKPPIGFTRLQGGKLHVRWSALLAANKICGYLIEAWDIHGAQQIDED
jgi:hypothetical protein